MNKIHCTFWNEVTHSFVDAVESRLQPLALEQQFMFDESAITTEVDAVLNEGRKEVAFVDTSVADYKTLEAGIRAGVEVVEIDGTQHGLAQIAKWAESHTGYDAIHILSHGEQGTLYLGTDALTQASLDSSVVQAELAELAQSLKAGGDLLLYGCNVAQGQTGANFIGKLAQITHANVAASDSLTGDAALGGNWVLEAVMGSVETQPLVVNGYQGVLVNASYTDFANAIGGNFVRTFSQSVSGYTLTVTTKDGLMYANTWGYNGQGVNAADMGLWDNMESQVTFSMPGYTFDVQSFVAASGMGTTTLKLTSTKGSYSFTLAATDYHIITPGSASLQGVTTFTLTSNVANGQFGVSFDDLILGNVQPVASGPTTTVTSASLSADNGSSATDWLTNTATQTISGTLSSALVAGESVQVSYDNGTTWSTAASSVGSSSWSATTTLSGSQVFNARVINASGNGTDYSHAYVIDATAPDTIIFSNPSSLSKLSTANFVFTGADNNFSALSYEVSLDGGAYTTSTSPKIYTGLADGSHTFNVRAIDGAGNKDATPASFTWIIDTSAPSAPTLALSSDTGSGNSDGKTSNAQVNVSGLESGATWQYSTNNGTNWTTGTGTNFTLTGDGAKIVVVRQTDAAGNVSSSSSALAFTLDTTASTPKLALSADTGSSNSDGKTSNGQVNVSGLESGATWQYSTNNGSTWTTGTGTNFTLTGDGAKSVIVRQTDVAGNVSANSPAKAFTLDATAPTTTITANDLNAPTGSDFSFTVQYADSGSGWDYATFDLSNVTITGPGSVGVLTVTSGGFNGITGLATYTVEAPHSGSWNFGTDAGTYTIAINGNSFKDLAGNAVAAVSAAKTFVVSFGSSNAAPTNIALSASSVAENTFTSSALTVGSLTSTDPDTGNTFTYSLVGGADSGCFQISGNSLQFKAGTPLDYETKSSYAVTVRSTDQDGLTYDKVLTVNLTDVNEAPTGVSLSASAVAENTATASALTVGSLTSTDPDTGNTFTYSLVGGADSGSFQISGNSLQFKAGTPLDYETKSSYAVTVRSTDQDGLTYDKVLTVNLTDVNEAPTSVSLSASTVAENTATASALTIGTLTSTDPDTGNTFSYSLVGGPDQASFQISGNNLQFKAGTPLDYETKSSYAVTVRSTDQGGLTYDKTLTVNLTDVNEAPTAANLTSGGLNSITAITDALVGTLAALDPDTGNTHTFTLVAGNGTNDADNSKFTLVGSSLKVGATPLAAGTYHVMTRATDQGGLSVDQAQTITIGAVNAAPTNVSLSASTVAENTATVSALTIGSLSSTDPDTGNTFTYSLVGGADQASFQISGNNLQFKAGTTLDYETKSSYAVTVRSTDQGGLTYDKVLTVNLTDVNEAPTGVALSASTVAENTATVSALTIGSLSSTDPDTGNTFTYSLVDGADQASFQISGNSLQFKAGTPLDYETKSSYVVTVRSTDQGGLTYDKTLTVNLTDVNEAPTNVSLSASTVAENTATASALTIGTLTSTDPDAVNTFTYSIVGGADQASFQISGSNLQFKAGTPLDYETKSSYAVTVRTTEQGGQTYDKVLTVNLTDVNEAPTAITLQKTIITLPENTSTANPIKVADISITDDAMGTNTITLSGADAGNFELIGNALFLKAGTLLDFETHANYLLNIQVSDNALQGSHPAQATFTLNLSNIVEAGQKPVSTAPPKLPAMQTWSTLSDKDGDGSPEQLEDYVGALNVTGSIAGDGNGDGILDSLQDSVTSMPFFKTPNVESASGNISSAFITLVADSLAGRPDTTDANTAQLRNVSQKDAAAHLPTDMEMPLGLIHFDALVSQKGQTETFSLYLDSEFSANGYWTQNATGTWVNLASKPYGGQMVNEGGKLRLDFQITDGGEFDADGQSNGVITDVGAIASMPLSLAGHAPVIPELAGSFWF